MKLTHIDVIREEARWDHLHRPNKRELHQFPQFLRRLRHQNTRHLVQIRHLKETLPKILLLQAHPGATEHHLLHRLGELRRHAVTHESAVADPHQAHPVHPVRLHEAHHALRLESLAPLGAVGGRIAEEEQVRDVDVEARHHVAEQFAVLPHGVGAEAVDEDEVGLGLLVRFGDPAVHGGAVV